MESNQTIKVSYTRLFATGNFEHMKIGLEVETDVKNLGNTFQNLVASAIALKENGLEIERKYTYEATSRARIKQLKEELSGLQAQLPESEES